MPLPAVDEFDAALAEMEDPSVGREDDDDQMASGDGAEDVADADGPAADAEAAFERRYQERFNRDVAALRSTYDKRLSALDDDLADLRIDVGERDEFIVALTNRYEQYDGDDLRTLNALRERRKAALKDQGRDKRKLARLESNQQAAQLASDRQQWLAENVARGVYPATFQTHPRIQQAIAAGDSDRDVMALIAGLLAGELRAPAKAARPATKVEQTKAREAQRGKQPLKTGGAVPPQTKATTFKDAEAIMAREMAKIGF